MKKVGIKKIVGLLMLLLACTGGYILGGITSEDNSVDAASRTVTKFDIDKYVASKGCPKCKGSLSFVTACGHSNYTSYIFICNSCFHHVELSPKGISLAPWTD